MNGHECAVMLYRRGVGEPFSSGGAVAFVNVRADVAAPHLPRRDRRGAAAAERVEHYVALIRGHQYQALNQVYGQPARVGFNALGAVADPVYVIPHVAYLIAELVAHVFLAAVVFDVGVAGAAGLVRRAHIVELALPVFGVEEYPVVRGLHRLAQRLAVGVPRYPMAEFGEVVQHSRRVCEELGDVIDENAAVRLQDAAGFGQPLPRPFHISAERDVVFVGSVLLVEVERRVGEDDVHRFVGHGPHQI